MRRSTSVFVGLVACAFTAGNLVVTVSAAPQRATRTSTASSSRTNSPSQVESLTGGSQRQGRLGDVAPQHLNVASLPHVKRSNNGHALNPHLVRDLNAYDEAKKHPKGKHGTAITQQTSTAATSAPTTTAGPKVGFTYGVNFAGINLASDFGGSGEPPDTQIAVGATRIVEMVNSTVQIYDKAGNPIGGGAYSLDDFFGVNSIFTPKYFGSEFFTTTDPRIMYDATSGRWFGSVLAYYPPNFDSLVVMGVSQTADPNGGWWVYPVDGEGPSLGGPGLVCDQPKIGVSSDKIGVACSLYNTTPAFTEGLLMIMSKSRAIAGLSLHESQFVDPTFFGMVPAQNMTAGVTTLYVAENLDTAGVADATGVMVVTGNVTTSASYAHLTPHTIAMTPTNVPPAAPQLGSTDTLDTNDDRFMSAFVQAGKLYTGGADSCQVGADPTVLSCLRLIEINASTFGLIQSDTAGLPGEFIISPTLGLNSYGDVGFAYSTSSATEYASVAQAVQPAGDFGTYVGGVVFAGTGPYVHSSPTSPARWGDYSSVAMDPSSAGYSWVAGEFSNGASNGTTTTWGTQIAKLNAHIPQVCTSPGLTPDVPSPQEPSADIHLTASATCVDPETPDFQFLIKTPGTTTFAVAQNYGNGDTFDWSSHVTLGTYTLEVRVRGLDETTKAYDVLKDITYLITTMPCTLPTVTTTPPSPRPIGEGITVSATTTCGVTPLYQFMVRTPDLVWHVGQAYSPSDSYDWSTLNTVPGNYLLSVRVKNTGSLAAYENYRNVGYTRVICTTPTLDTGAAASPYVSGSGDVTLTANASCKSEQYQFRYRDPALLWHTIQSYSGTNTATFHADYKAGNYLLEVQVRPAGSLAAYVTYKDIPFTLTGCTLPTLVSDLNSPQLAGATVNWTADATCTGAGKEFKFTVRTPTAVTTTAQDWSATATFPWATPSTLGTYTITVYARNVNATNDTTGDVAKAVAFVVGLCTTPTLGTGAATSPYTSGSGDITLTGLASCKTATQYQFRYKDTVNVWHTIRVYNTTPTATWHADFKAGTYVLEVQARPTGSIAAYVTYKDLTFVLTGCGVPALTSDLASPQIRAATITFIASATCSGTPQYRFLVKAPGALTSVVARDWGSDTFVWNSPAVAGTYTITVLARNTGAAEDAGDASKAIAYKLS